MSWADVFEEVGAETVHFTGDEKTAVAQVYADGIFVRVHLPGSVSDQVILTKDESARLRAALQRAEESS